MMKSMKIQMNQTMQIQIINKILLKENKVQSKQASLTKFVVCFKKFIYDLLEVGMKMVENENQKRDDVKKV